MIAVTKAPLRTTASYQQLGRSAPTRMQLTPPRMLSARREMKSAVSFAKRMKGRVVVSKLA